MTFPTEWKNNPNVPNHQPGIFDIFCVKKNLLRSETWPQGSTNWDPMTCSGYSETSEDLSWTLPAWIWPFPSGNNTIYQWICFLFVPYIYIHIPIYVICKCITYKYTQKFLTMPQWWNKNRFSKKTPFIYIYTYIYTCYIYFWPLSSISSLNEYIHIYYI